MSYKKVIKVFIPNSDKQISILFKKVSPAFSFTQALGVINDGDVSAETDDNFYLVNEFNSHLSLIEELEGNVREFIKQGCEMSIEVELEFRGGSMRYKISSIQHSIYPLYSTIVTTYYLHEII